MYKRIWLLMIIALATATLGTTPTARGAGGNNAIAPQVIDTSPARGVRRPPSPSGTRNVSDSPGSFASIVSLSFQYPAITSGTGTPSSA